MRVTQAVIGALILMGLFHMIVGRPLAVVITKELHKYERELERKIRRGK